MALPILSVKACGGIGLSSEMPMVDRSQRDTRVWWLDVCGDMQAGSCDLLHSDAPVFRVTRASVVWPPHLEAKRVLHVGLACVFSALNEGLLIVAESRPKLGIKKEGTLSER